MPHVGQPSYGLIQWVGNAIAEDGSDVHLSADILRDGRFHGRGTGYPKESIIGQP
jgi:hypothetical protein